MVLTFYPVPDTSLGRSGKLRLDKSSFVSKFLPLGRVLLSIRFFPEIPVTLSFKERGKIKMFRPILSERTETLRNFSTPRKSLLSKKSSKQVFYGSKPFFAVFIVLGIISERV